MIDCKPVAIPVASEIKLETSSNCQLVDVTKYRQFIGSLLYLTISRSDIAYAFNLMARFMHKP